MRTLKHTILTLLILAAGGCVFGVSGKVARPVSGGAPAADELIPGVRVLASEPFNMPDGFPLPAGAFRVDRDPTARDIVFHTTESVEELVEFYREKLSAAGLKEHPDGTVQTELGFRLVFLGWPGPKALLLQGSDASKLGQATAALARVVHARLAEVEVRDSTKPAASANPSARPSGRSPEAAQ